MIHVFKLKEHNNRDMSQCVPIVSQSGVDGLIVSNTTVDRPATLESKHKTESGGLSGQPLKTLATNTVRDMYRLTNGMHMLLTE